MANGSGTGQFRSRSDPFTKIVMGVVGSLLVAVVVGGIAMYADMQVMKEKQSLLQEDKAADERQDATLIKQWKFLSFLKAEVDALRHQQGMPPSPSPDLGD
jgi:hypothetical protein